MTFKIYTFDVCFSLVVRLFFYVASPSVKIRKPFSPSLRPFRDGSGMVVRIDVERPSGGLIYHRLYI
jgi:hypothetical protein